jgi:hypothetical protein
VASGDGAVEQDVTEPRRALVDCGHPERGMGGISHPDGHGVADAKVAAVGEHAADGDGAAAHVEQRPCDHVGVERARRPVAAEAGGRPWALVAQAGGEGIDLRPHDRGDGVDSAER